MHDIAWRQTVFSDSLPKIETKTEPQERTWQLVNWISFFNYKTKKYFILSQKFPAVSSFDAVTL